ncbi:hypothetical protein SCUCBS95973_006582 [Sporothrix curviconia]|uniref:Uncharacterized protein n=1 Tax=Sporothrix curviconia TaxID=1260050 RepID=A0ABP0C6C3_9PEZI
MAARLVGRLWLALLVCAIGVAANVEKTIFVAGHGEKGGLRSDIVNALPRLTPAGNAWRTGLEAVFPWTEAYPDNGTTWALLDDLSEGQRYELRVCWAATQPTAFWVDVYDFAAVQADHELARSLDKFVEQRGSEFKSSGSSSFSPSTTSLLVKILAVADFVAANRSAMQPGSIPPVLTDVILDPFLFNVLPRSLVPVVGAILAVAGVSAWLARGAILPGLRAVAVDGREDKEVTKAASRQNARRS